MTNPVLHKNAIDLIVTLNAAVTNARLYPPTSALIVNSVKRMVQAVTDILKETAAVEYAESEKNLLVQGEVIPDKEQQKPQVASFLRVMTDLGIRSITIKKGVTENEVADFIQIMGMSADDVKTAGGIKTLFQNKQIGHIAIDEQIYVKMDSERRIVADMKISDRDIAASLLGEPALEKQELDRVRELFKDPGVVSRIFREGVRQVMAEPGNREPVSDTLAGLIEALKELSGDAAVAHSKDILNALMTMEDAVLKSIFTRNMDETFGESVFSEFIESLEESQFNALMARILGMRESVSRDEAYSEAQVSAVDHVLEIFRASSKGKALPERTEAPGQTEPEALTEPSNPPEPLETIAAAAPPASRENRIEKLKTVLSSILKGDTARLSDLSDVDGLAAVISQLAEKKKNFAVDAVIERLGRALLDEDQKVRKTAAELLSRIDKRLEGAEFFDKQTEINRKLVEWIRYEYEISDVYERIAGQLQQNARQMMAQGAFTDAREIIDAYNQIYTGSLSKNESITALAESMLQNISTEDVLDLLLKEGPDKQANREKKEIYSLILMGTTTVERFLDRLLETHSRSERRRIIQAITKIGAPAARPVEERLKQGGPWFYVRNLVMILGRIGDASHLKLLESIFLNEDLRVQREVAFAIQAIDPAATGEILLRNLYTVGPENLGLLISMLGLLKYRDAAPVLIEMLASGSTAIPKKVKTTVLIKTCEALGKIRDTEAIGPLKHIARSKGFLSIRAVDAEVREAARAALREITKSEKGKN